ncbi:hypothetical protein Trydic_g521 [Trypoxylus dichotomus]
MGNENTQNSGSASCVSRNENSMVLYNVDAIKVFNIITSLKDTLSVGPDRLPTKLVKSYADILCTPIVNLINLSFETDIHPDHLKTATITSMYTSGDETNIERSIALGTIIATVAEKATLSGLISFTASCNILTPFQNAYIQGKSTAGAIYITITKITQAMKKLR